MSTGALSDLCAKVRCSTSMAGVSADIERVEDFFICFDAAVFGADRRMIGIRGKARRESPVPENR